MEELKEAINALALPALGEEADWLGHVDDLIRRLREKRAAVMSELDAPISGEAYRVTASRNAKRSYNTAAIMAHFADQGWALKDLLEADACRLTWRWSELKRAAVQANVALSIAHHEVNDAGDIEEEMIGEVWASAFRVESV